jgi:hypothetical protein
MNEEAARKNPSDSASRGRLGTAARELGLNLTALDPARALAVFDLGIRRLGETPNSLKSRRERAGLLAKSSYALRRLHRDPEAKSRVDAAEAILRDTKDYPAQKIQLGSPAETIVRARADYAAESGDLPHAIEMYEELLRQILATEVHPETSLPDAVALSHLYITMARLDRRARRTGPASDFEARCLELWRHWDTRLPHNSFVARQLKAAQSPLD